MKYINTATMPGQFLEVSFITVDGEAIHYNMLITEDFEDFCWRMYIPRLDDALAEADADPFGSMVYIFYTYTEDRWALIFRDCPIDEIPRTLFNLSRSLVKHSRDKARGEA